ncbi:hypothetical protein AAV35_011540 [Salimicrobium jeotgali]|uniref:Uncharacterized protein n=1 Tax=Salimicrobium jeotgali TaxID=1230341 RepID=K2GLR4_9BACI|nr:hypothetical protein [Salimicrobium jeotgali]AKG05348.1 hypothetical protein AAV35_011540 [Salimicrobium jeotgali]EKE31354.1 hypothetical protein MJ3_08961 [Salimicrobium jeotgali]MBM7696963.1 hypothetical protein [Salimicrobium jeotgali]
MILDFEKWLHSQDFSPEATNQFKEAVTCYKASAYRASLLMSYLGFQIVLKDRVLESSKPDNLHEKAWEAIKKRLRKEEAWDEEVNECIKKNDVKKRVFVISEDLRNQATYWKYRRNDCAHSKPNKIDSSHVESFWLFLRSNLAKFVVGGSMESLLLKLDKHLDPNFTSSKASHKTYIDELPKTILEEDIIDFLERLHNLFQKHFFFYPEVEEKPLGIWNDIIRLEGQLGKQAVLFIKDNKGLEIEFLEQYPERTSLFYEKNSPEVRKLWRQTIHNEFSKMVRLEIFVSLLRNGLIEEDMSESLEYMVKNIKRTELTEETIKPLKDFGYFNVFKDLVFSRKYPLLDSFDWGNEAYVSIGDHLDQIGLDEHVVEVINNTFESRPYPFKMQEALKSYFAQREGEREEYEEICDELGIKPTDTLGF